MKYFVADFKIVCEAEQLQVARELLSAAACEAGFEAFEDSDEGLQGYVQRPMSVSYTHLTLPTILLV